MSITAKMSKKRFPTDGNRAEAILYPYSAKKGRGPSIATRCIGLTSGATGLVTGFYKSPDRIHISLVTNGQGGDAGIPFLPNEEVEEVGDDTRGVTLSAVLKQANATG